MAQCVQSVQEFIQDSFVPMVAVLCSKEADRVTRKNNLTFAELLKPFCRLTSEGHIRDPNNQLQTVKNLRICVSSLVTGRSPAPPSLSPAQRRLLSEAVSGCQPPEGPPGSALTAGDYSLSLNATTPWFEAYRENFLQSMPAADHEFLNHYLACLLVVSSTEAVPVEQFLALSQEQHRVQHSGDYSAPKWFIPNTLKYYVLLHDAAEGDQQRADSVYEDMKQRYGPQGCYLLRINSRSASAPEQEQIPDPWSQFLQRSNPRTLDCEEAPGGSEGENEAPAAEEGISPAVPDAPPGGLEAHPLQLEADGSSASLHSLSTGGGGLGGGAGGAPGGHGTSPGGATGGAPGGHGACLTLSDHDHIRQFVQEFTFRGLLPHIEKNIRQLNDQLISRKGLSRSLFTATKKWFGGGKAPEKGVAEPRSSCGLLYPPEAPELQIRKMADLCFLVQLYDLAYSCYHTAKKDFLSDQAMLYAAGALEMAAVSAFLQPGPPRPYPSHYMDTAIQTYRDVCRNMVLAERCALLSAEVLKSQGKFSEAAALLIKMTSEDSDLRSALLLEQAAHCFINMRGPMVRKFAFHMILAGHRFSKAAQRKHALRCYLQAMQVYRDRGWSLAEDHINFTIGRQSFTLGQPGAAADAFRCILVNDSRQTAAQQSAFLREYLYVYKSVISCAEADLPQLPLPCIHSAATRVYFGHERRLAEGEKQAATHVSLDQEYDQELSAMWAHLEEQLVAAANRGVLPPHFQPTQSCLNSQTDNLRQPLAVVEEPIMVEVSFRNPLKVPLALADLSLLWRFSADGAPEDESANERANESTNERAGGGVGSEDAAGPEVTQDQRVVTTEVIAEFLLGPEETKMARLKLLPHRPGQLQVVGVEYSLSSPSAEATPEGAPPPEQMEVRGRQELQIQGPRLNLTKEDKMAVRHGPDRRLEPAITPPMPLMEVFFLQFPSALLCGEVRRAYVEFSNVSGEALGGLRVASTHPSFFTFGRARAPLTPPSPASACSAYPTVAAPPGGAELRLAPPDPPPPGGVVEVPIGTLQPGEAAQLPLWLRGPDQEGVHEINLLFYYQSTRGGPRISHRVLRHTVFICASRSLSVQASARRSSAPPHEGSAPPARRHDGDSSGTLVFIDVENVNTSDGGVREFHIVQVSSSSQNWRLHKYINPDKDRDCRLSSRERAKLCFCATRCPPAPGPGSMEKYTFADLNLGNERVLSSSTPCGDFFFRCCPLQRAPGGQTAPAGRGSAPSDQRAAAISRGSAPNDQRAAISRGSAPNDHSCSELDLHIIVIWKAYVVEDNKQLILEGQLHVALQAVGQEASSLTPKEEAQEMVLLRFRSDLPVLSPSAELSQLIKTNLHHPESISHHFHLHSLCLVPVTLTLSNCSVTPVEVEVDLRHRETSQDWAEVHSSFSWVGQSQFRLVLPPRQVSRLALRACFLRPGVYNLSTPRVLARPPNATAAAASRQQPASPALIIINGA